MECEGSCMRYYSLTLQDIKYKDMWANCNVWTTHGVKGNTFQLGRTPVIDWMASLSLNTVQCIGIPILPPHSSSLLFQQFPSLLPLQTAPLAVFYHFIFLVCVCACVCKCSPTNSNWKENPGNYMQHRIPTEMNREPTWRIENCVLFSIVWSWTQNLWESGFNWLLLFI